jgi:hypothetical protein
MWFDVMTALSDHLNAIAELAGVHIELGANAQVPDCKTVILTRGQFEPKNNDRQSINKQIIYVECWEFDDHDSPKKGYEKLAALEGLVFAAINGFGFTCVNTQQIKVRLGQTEPDGDAFRPSVGSRTTITIEWR